jgi:hypothetical protein
MTQIVWGAIVLLTLVLILYRRERDREGRRLRDSRVAIERVLLAKDKVERAFLADLRNVMAQRDEARTERDRAREIGLGFLDEKVNLRVERDQAHAERDRPEDAGLRKPKAPRRKTAKQRKRRR